MIRRIPRNALKILPPRFRLSRFLRGEGPEDGPVTLDRRRVYVLPTRHGYLFAAVLAVMALGSLNYNSNPGLGLSFLLGSLAVVSILHTYRNLAHLAFRSGRPEPVFAGQEAHFPIRIENPSGRRRYDISLRVAATGRSATVDVPEGYSTVVLSREASLRGLLELGRFTVEARFPLSLFRAWSHLEFRAACLVYPQPGSPGRWQAGGVATGERGRGQEDFSGLRAYLPGDPLRQIHWKSSARTETLVTKEFSGSTQGEIWLDWEGHPELEPEARLSRLCRLALDVHGAGAVWGLRLPASAIGPGRGPDHLHRCLAALATFPGPGSGSVSP